MERTSPKFSLLKQCLCSVSRWVRDNLRRLSLSILILFVSCIFLIPLSLLTSCHSKEDSSALDQESTAKEPAEFRPYLATWNNYIRAWLQDQIRLTEAERDRLQQELSVTSSASSISSSVANSSTTSIPSSTSTSTSSSTTGTSATTSTATPRSAIESKLSALKRQLDTYKTRLSDGDYFQFKSPADLPDSLTWEDGLDNPDIGDPQAKKGGHVTLWEPVSYPDTFRQFGPNSNNTFRGRLFDELILNAVGLHPVTGKIMPAVCHQWATDPDGRTVYFRIDPEARYADGAPVRAMDFLLTVYVRTSDYANSPFDKEFFREEIAGITVFDDMTFSVTLPTPKPLAPFYAALYPSSPTFFAEYGPDFIERYQWRIEPTTGGYTIRPGDFIRGRQITFSRVKDWWARDKKFYRYSCNVNHITYLFLAEESKGLELFRTGQIDILLVNKPDLWHEKMEIPEVHNGYIERATFYTSYPRYPVGLFLNEARPPFNDLNMRLGFQHAVNMQRVDDIVYRGDYQRLNSYCSGFGKFTNPKLRAREYSPEKAREYFARAGFTHSGSDGILRNDKGDRLTAELTYSATNPSLRTSMSIIKEDAKKAGLDLELDDLDGNVSFRKVMEKRHQATFWAWGFTPPHPRTYQNFHSSFAYDEKGLPLPHTNNITSSAHPDLDKAVEAERNARTEDELQQASWKAQQLIHDLAVWVPGSNSEFTRIAYWRWIKWPDSPTTRFCHPMLFEPAESHLYWVDEELKKETLSAKKQHIAFPEQERIFDQYRTTPTLKP